MNDAPFPGIPPVGFFNPFNDIVEWVAEKVGCR
jgi:hypothetical protein